LPAFPKKQRVRLDPDAYDQLRKQVLERDAWRCQHCGRRTQLEVHHLTRRSSMGSDTEENLITLCHECHRATHTLLVRYRLST
jgi:5-methylcytosine-specific restriction endonuclease McrA